MPDGRRVALSTRVSEDMAAQVDRARGSLTRSAWVEQAIREALFADSKMPGTRSPSGPRPPGRVQAPATVISRRPSARRQADCPHPRARVVKGLCGACGTGGLG
jgi:hypothetical protein